MSFPDPNQPGQNQPSPRQNAANENNPPSPVHPQSHPPQLGQQPPVAQPQFAQPVDGQPVMAKPQYNHPQYPQAHVATDHSIRNILLVLGGIGIVLLLTCGGAIGLGVYQFNKMQTEFNDLAMSEFNEVYEPEGSSMALQDTIKDDPNVKQRIGTIVAVNFDYNRTGDQNLGFVTTNWYRVSGDQGVAFVQTQNQSASQKWFDKIDMEQRDGTLVNIPVADLPYSRDAYPIQSQVLYHRIKNNDIIKDRIGEILNVSGDIDRTIDETSDDEPVYWLSVTGANGIAFVRARYADWSDDLVLAELEGDNRSLTQLKIERKD